MIELTELTDFSGTLHYLNIRRIDDIFYREHTPLDPSKAPYKATVICIGGKELEFNHTLDEMFDLLGISDVEPDDTE